MKIVLKKYPKLTGSKIINETVRLIINLLVTDLIKNSNSNIKSTGIVTTEDVKNCSKVIIGFSNEVKRLNIGLKKFLYANLYKHPDVMQMTNQANRVIKDLFSSYISDIKLLPNDYYQYNLKKINSGFKERVICDYIAGMTDRFAQQEHGKLFNSI
jgi:dGTPase